MVALAALAMGCSAADGSSSTDGGGGKGSKQDDPSSTTGTPGGDDGDASLTVDSAELTPLVSGYSPNKEGNLFLVLTATLKNESETPPLPASFELFSLKTVDQLVYAPTGISSSLDGACLGDVSVAAGGTKTCIVAFEVAPTAKAQELDYVMPKHVSLAANVPAPTQAACDEPPMITQNCYSCMQQRCVGPAVDETCVNGTGQCMEDCWLQGGEDLCSCQQSCHADDACVDVFSQISTCATNQCGCG
jgi:hypothetical protein